MEAVEEWEQEAEEERGEEEKVVDECGMTGMTGALIYTEDCSGAGARMQTQKSWPGLGLGDAGPRKMSVIYCLVNLYVA